LISATVALSGGTFAGDGDVLAATATGSITVSYNSSSEVLTLTGSDTLANYQTVLDSVTFTTPSDNPTNFRSAPTPTLPWTVVDDTGTTTSTGPATTTTDITAIKDPPALTSVATSATYVENAAPTTLASTASVSDIDSLTLANATVRIVGGTFAGDGD